MPEPKGPTSRGNTVADALRRYVDALVEMSQTTRERAERVLDDLAKRGEPLTKEMQRSVREIVDRSTRNQRELVSLVQKEFRRLTAREAVEGSDVGASKKKTAAQKMTAAKKKTAKRKAPAKRKPGTAKRSTTVRKPPNGPPREDAPER